SKDLQDARGSDAAVSKDFVVSEDLRDLDDAEAVEFEHLQLLDDTASIYDVLGAEGRRLGAAGEGLTAVVIEPAGPGEQVGHVSLWIWHNDGTVERIQLDPDDGQAIQYDTNFERPAARPDRPGAWVMFYTREHYPLMAVPERFKEEMLDGRMDYANMSWPDDPRRRPPNDLRVGKSGYPGGTEHGLHSPAE